MAQNASSIASYSQPKHTHTRRRNLCICSFDHILHRIQKRVKNFNQNCICMHKSQCCLRPLIFVRTLYSVHVAPLLFEIYSNRNFATRSSVFIVRTYVCNASMKLNFSAWMNEIRIGKRTSTKEEWWLWYTILLIWA